jgi:hypothetical protein
MSSKFFCVRVAIAVLLMSAPCAFAQTPVDQTSNNNSPVVNSVTISISGGLPGAGASASINATGAVTSTTVTGINTPLIYPSGGFGAINQASHNNLDEATVTNTGTINNNGGTLGTGSTISIGATGALASTAVTGIGNAAFLAPALAFGSNVSQSATNDAIINNTGTVNADGLTVPGAGASVLISATGALSSLSIGSIGGASFDASAGVGGVDQSATNIAAVTNSTGNGSNFGFINLGSSVGHLSGNGASASFSAAGAVTQTSLSFIDTPAVTGGAIGNITQGSTNSADVDNSTGSLGGIVSVGALQGHGASASVNANGAVSSVSLSYTLVCCNLSAGPSFTVGAIDQVSTNGGLTNTGTIDNSSAWVITNQLGNGALSGNGASASINAGGATTSVSVVSIGSIIGAQMLGDVTQESTSTYSSDTNSSILNAGGKVEVNALSGLGSSASINAHGALASVSSASIFSDALAAFSVGNIQQSSVTSASPVNNDNGLVTTAGGNLGIGALASIGASGTVASVSVTNIGSITGSVTLGGIAQTALNQGSGISNVNELITVGSLGDGASASIRATGASASVSRSNINSTEGGTSLAAASITQEATNIASIVTNTGVITAGTLCGTGSSAVIGATGAAASVAVSSINPVGALGAVGSIGPITQTANNSSSAVTNTGMITLSGPISGNGASASISAIGAAASVSFSTIH